MTRPLLPIGPIFFHPLASPRPLAVLSAALTLLAATGRAQESDLLAPPTGTTESEDVRDAQTLDRFVVETSRLHDRSWHYIELPGYEVLTRCSEDQNAYYLAALQREARVEAAMLPAGYLTPLSARNAVILYDSKPAGELAYTIPQPAAVEEDDPTLWGRYAGQHLTGTGGGEDADTRADCLNLWGRATGGALYTTRAFSTRLLHRTPTLPGWFVQGLIGPAGIYKRGFRFITPDGAVDRSESFAYFPASLWISDQRTEALRANPLARTEFLPLEEFFAAHDGWTAARAPLWASQAALFTRWGLFGAPKDEAHRPPFLAFVARVQTEGPSEALFHDCFGLTYAQGEDQLRRFLPKALAAGIRLHLDSYVSPAPSAPRLATPDEVARLIGDWERINGKAFRASYPTLSSKYFAAAGALLTRRYAEGGRDPQLLGVFGLYCHDTGDEERARPLLERAQTAATTRPLVLATLGRLRLSTALAHPDGAGDRLGAAQMAGILEPLRRARTLDPALAETYEVWAKALRHGSAATEIDRDALEEGARLFPTAAAAQ